MTPEVCGLGVQNFGRYGFWQRTAQTMAAPDFPPPPQVPGDVFLQILLLPYTTHVLLVS